jgi:hypothetical protein
MFVGDDLESLANATGLSETEVITHPELGKEYIRCLRLQHSLGLSGALSTTTKIVMLRLLGFEGRPRPASDEALNWRLVKKGTQVVVTPDLQKPERKHGGMFQYFDEGRLVVLLDGSLSGPDEFSKEQVAIAPEGTLPFIPKPEQLQPSVNGSPKTEPDTELDEPTPSVELVTGRDSADPEGPADNPTMEMDWTEFDVGSPVWYRVGRNMCEAEFVDIGPKDGHITVAVWTPLMGEDSKPVKDEKGKKVMRQVHKLIPESQISQEAPQKKTVKA